MPAIDPAWIALIGTLCGGLGLKLIEHWLGKSRVKIDEASKLRDELRIQIDDLREETRQLEAAVEKWRKDYYDLRDQYTQLNTQYTIALENIKKAAEATAKKVDESLDPPK